MTSPSSTDSGITTGRLRSSGAALARTSGLLIAVVILMVLFGALSQGDFLKIPNLLGLLRSTSTIAIMGMGLTMVIVVGEIDLSFAAVYGLCATVAAVIWMELGFPVSVAIGVAFLAAIGIALVNGFFTTVVKVPSFIATLGASTIIYGITLFVGATQTFNPAYPVRGQAVARDELSFFTGLSNLSLPFGFPMQGVWLIMAALLFWFLLGRSLFGFRLKAIGGNSSAASLARLRVRKYKFLAFVLCSVMACLAALLDFAFVGSTSPASGQSLLFPVFAAVIIGGASLTGGRGRIAGTVMGALVLAVLTNGLAVVGAGTALQQMVLGAVTIGAVVLDQATRRFGR